MKKQTIYLLIISGVLAILAGCTKIGEYYAGLHLQPDMSDSPYEPGLNVFGVVKAGQDFDTLNHFFEVQKMMDMLDWSEGMVVTNATVELVRHSDNTPSQLYVMEHLTNGVYINENFKVEPGDFWEYSCKSDSFNVSASAIVPQLPVLSGDVNVTGQSIEFSLQADTTAYMYLFYLIGDEQVYTENILPDFGQENSIVLTPQWQEWPNELRLYVCAYDQHLREYITTSNTFFKPNAFRPAYSTVTGGYGTFGAVAITHQVIAVANQ